MTRISIINIGNELLSGQCVDTNSAWLGLKLAENGLEVADKFAVGDEIADIMDCLRLAAKKSNIILITGGLGPTDDDLTREAIAKFFGVELEFSQPLFEQMSSYFTNRGIAMADKNRVQAYLPAGAKPLINTCGTAPGVNASDEKVHIYAMPGVPSEMKAMFTGGVLPELKEIAGSATTVCKKLKCIGIGESSLAEKIGDMMLRGRNPLINCTVSNSVITLYVVAKAGSKELAQQMVDAAVLELRAVIGQYIFGEDDQELAEVIGNMLVAEGATMATAESCTGGMIAKMLTDIPGSSRFFGYGWVTYANEAKMSQLGVSKELLDKQGAVCEDVVRQMVKGALVNSGSDYAIAVSGIAGPTGGTEDKPVGLVYIGAGSKEKCVVEKKVYLNGRDIFRIRTSTAALDLLRREFLIEV
ncbi:MAG: competence/damage-inducible protein A [Sedimentisphaeraceae bacterium JB056]